MPAALPSQAVACDQGQRGDGGKGQHVAGGGGLDLSEGAGGGRGGREEGEGGEGDGGEVVGYALGMMGGISNYYMQFWVGGCLVVE